MDITSLHWTRIKNDKLNADAQYILGVIDGIQYVVCGLSAGEMQTLPNGDYLIGVNCIDIYYQNFAALVEHRYPGLCTFDVSYKG